MAQYSGCIISAQCLGVTIIPGNLEINYPTVGIKYNRFTCTGLAHLTGWYLPNSWDTKERIQSKNTLSAGWVFPSSKLLIEASRKLQCVRQGQPISARCQQRPAPSFGMCWWRIGEHYFSSSLTQEIPLTTPSWFALILDTHHMCPQLSFPLPQSFQSFCSTFRWWKLKTCGYNFYEKFHFESLLNFNFIAIRKQKKTKDLSHPLTQKPLVKTFNKCKFSAASCWKSWPLDSVSFICFYKCSMKQ